MKSTKCKCITTKYGKAKVCSCGLKCWCVHMCPFMECVCVCVLGRGENKSSMTMAVVARVTHSQGSNWSKRSQIHDPAKIHNLQVSICNCNILQKKSYFHICMAQKCPRAMSGGPIFFLALLIVVVVLLLPLLLHRTQLPKRGEGGVYWERRVPSIWPCGGRGSPSCKLDPPSLRPLLSLTQ